MNPISSDDLTMIVRPQGSWAVPTDEESGPGGVDDWLEDESAIKWFPDLGPGSLRSGLERGAAAAGAAVGGARGADATPAFVRRRLLAAAAAGSILLVVVVAWLLASGGSPRAGAPAATTGLDTAPAVTTPAGTTTSPPAAPTPAAPRFVLAANATLAAGDTGSPVRALQRDLDTLGFAAGTADGDFGPHTQAAVVAFQRAHGLASDGVVGKHTAAALNAALAKHAAAA